MRFHLDEHLPAAISAGLRRRGIDITTTVEANLSGATDEAQFAYALAEHRVIITQDADFLVLATTRSHAGVVYCAPGHGSIRKVIAHLELMHLCMNENEMLQRIEFM